jgi:hypothetical protein
LLRDGSERFVAELGRKQPDERCRRLATVSPLLDLEAAVAGRKLELPEGDTVLDASAERESVLRERPRLGVVIRRGDDMRHTTVAPRRSGHRRFGLELRLRGDLHC